MKLFTIFKRKKTRPHSPTSVRTPPKIPQASLLTKSLSCHQNVKSMQNNENEHIYQVLDPSRDVESPKVGAISRFPVSQSYPQNMHDRCNEKSSFLTPNSLKSGQSTSCSLCSNCQMALSDPVVKSASPRRHRTMIKTNPWISSSQSNFCSKNKNQFSSSVRESINRDLVSPYATSEDLFIPTPTNPDISIDSGIFDASLQTAGSMSTSCSDESEEVSSYFRLPGHKRNRPVHRERSIKSQRLFIKQENYLWRPYNVTNCSFQLPRSNLCQFQSPYQNYDDDDVGESSIMIDPDFEEKRPSFHPYAQYRYVHPQSSYYFNNSNFLR